MRTADLRTLKVTGTCVWLMSAWLLAVAIGTLPAAAQKANSNTITVFAAASLKNALDAASSEYSKATGKKVLISYASSSALAKQIEQAAPADIFISADLDWMDYLAERKLIRPETRSNLLGNRLVLIAPADKSVALKIAPGFDLAGALGDGKLAMGDVKSVPAGKYGRAALEKLRAWGPVESKIAPAENVRAALALVARGEAALGIAYRTDALAEPKVRIIDTFPDGTHPPIVYPIAITVSAVAGEASADLMTFLKSTVSEAIFIKEGYSILK